MKTPTIHSNGTGLKTLLQEAENAADALTKAQEALHKITVHGRDFYLQKDHAYADAREEYRDLLARFETVKNEVESYYHSLLAITL